MSVVNVMTALALARLSVKQTKMSKGGRNTFSNYAYFTPEQVDLLAYKACEEAGLITIFNLVRNEYGLQGVLTIHHVLTSEEVEFAQATDVPSIKATNIAQQMGGMVTYTERYLTMTAFGIKDNSLDFDSHDNRNSTPKETAPVQEERQPEKPWMEMSKIGNAVDWAIENGKNVSDIESIYQIMPDVKVKLVEKFQSKLK